MLREIARTYAKAETATILWGMGVCQFRQGVETVRALASLAMLTGNLGKPNVGVNPVRGQNNVQGACDMGALYNTLPGIKAMRILKSTPNLRKHGAYHLFQPNQVYH